MQRYDAYRIKAVKTKEGFIRDTPVVGRTGILKYRNADGSTRLEYRPPEEAFNADSLNSLKGMPITVGHKAMVTAQNAARVQPIGTILSNGRQDGDDIVADVVIYDLPTAARELSCGYNLDLDETPGTTPDGQHYDAVQRNIRYNHVAVVPRGRAGVARLNMDGEQIIDTEETERNDDTVAMTKVRTDNGIEYDAAPEVAVFVQKLQNDAKEQQTKLDQLQAKYDAALDDVKKAKQEKEDAIKESKEKMDEAVRERVSMLDTAKKHNIEKADELSNMDIKKAVIKAVRGDSFNVDGKSVDYINAAFDMAKDDIKNDLQRADSVAKQRQSLYKHDDEQKHDADDPQAAYDKLRQDEADLWMKEVK